MATERLRPGSAERRERASLALSPLGGCLDVTIWPAISPTYSTPTRRQLLLIRRRRGQHPFIPRRPPSRPPPHHPDLRPSPSSARRSRRRSAPRPAAAQQAPFRRPSRPRRRPNRPGVMLTRPASTNAPTASRDTVGPSISSGTSPPTRWASASSVMWCVWLSTSLP